MGYIIYAFAGVGKTTFCKSNKDCIELEESQYRYLDDEIGETNKGKEKSINKDFPNNYFRAINECLNKYKYVFVSYNALQYCIENNIDYSIILPRVEDKNEYIKRYIARNNSNEFINNLNQNYEAYIRKEKNDKYAEHIIFLDSGEYLANGMQKLENLKNETISLIIPIYNSEKYLNGLFSSIRRQTYTKLEIILIDDGSTDNSKNICKNFENNDARVKYYYKKNSGVSSARNMGLKKATGKYVCFIDSDDVLENEYCEKLLKAIQFNNSDFAFCGINEINDSQKNQYGGLNIYGNANDPNYFINIFNNFWFPVLWNKIYKRSIVVNNNIRFSTSINYDEDTIFNFKYYENCRKINTISDCLYNYYIRNTGLTQNGLKNVFSKSYKTIFYRYNYPKKKFGENKQAIYISSKKILKAILQEINMMKTNNQSYKAMKGFFDDCMSKYYVKKTIKNICILESDYKDWFLYKKVFEQNNIGYYLKYISH